jgi:MFS family permease
VGGFLLFSYMPTYLHRVVRLSPGEAFGANLAGLAALMAGAVAGGYLVDRFGPRGVAIGCAAGVGRRGRAELPAHAAGYAGRRPAGASRSGRRASVRPPR